jgi:hypothetical protein
MFEMLGNDQRAQESRDKASEYREASGTKSLLDALFEPLPVWLVIPAGAGGLFLFRRRNR